MCKAIFLLHLPLRILSKRGAGSLLHDGWGGNREKTWRGRLGTEGQLTSVFHVWASSPNMGLLYKAGVQQIFVKQMELLRKNSEGRSRFLPPQRTDKGRKRNKVSSPLSVYKGKSWPPLLQATQHTNVCQERAGNFKAYRTKELSAWYWPGFGCLAVVIVLESFGGKKLKRAFKTRRENVSHTAYPDVHCVRLKASRGGHVHPSASWSSEILPRVPSVCFRLKWQTWPGASTYSSDVHSSAATGPFFCKIFYFAWKLYVHISKPAEFTLMTLETTVLGLTLKHRET